jgi:hypothetical protein
MFYEGPQDFYDQPVTRLQEQFESQGPLYKELKKEFL